MTATARLCGFGPETGPRMPVALTAIGTILFLFWLLKPRLGYDLALHSSILLACCAGWLAFGFVSVVDVPLTAAMTVCVLMIVFEAGPPWVAGAFLGLAVLAKGLVPLVLFAPLLWWLWKQRRLRDLGPIALAGLVIAGPWYVAMAMRHGTPFLVEFIVKHHFQRFFSDSLQHVRPFWFYAPVLLGLLAPWTLIFGPRRPPDSRLSFLAIWVCYGFLFFSLSKNKLPGYVLPLLPVLCILLASSLRSIHAALFGIAALAATYLELRFLPELPRFLAEGLNRTPNSQFVWWHVIAGVVMGLACYAAAKRGHYTNALVLIAGIVAAGVLVVKLGGIADEVDRLATARPLSKTARRDGCVHPGDRNLRYGLSYYWGFEVPVCNDATLDERIQR